MDEKNFKLAEEIINSSYVRLGENSVNKRNKIMKEILSQRQLPPQPLDELTIRYFLDTIALMDSNNFDQKVGVGERQSRIFSRLVEERHFYMGHGIGRSGDVMANQPKAAGSSLLLQMARFLTVSALNQLNYEFVDQILLLPLATGMSLSLAFLTLAQQKPEKKYVIWSRIDQKTCLKSIITANLQPIVVELRQVGDSLMSDLEAIEAKIIEIGQQNILAVVSTTSCFAPRIPDNVEEASILAKKYGIFHVVNNAYGIWCSKIANSIKQGMRKGECTVVVQSTDKNFMVPVGGSIIFANSQKIIEKISSKYPGRANGSPILDMFITLLSMGKSTLKNLKKQRKQGFQFMKKIGNSFAQKHKFRLLVTPLNSISIGMHFSNIDISNEQLTQLGSILYSKRVMGHRVIVESEKVIKIGKNSFKNYGSHKNEYTYLPYITFACAVGTKMEEIQIFFTRLEEAMKQLQKKLKKKKESRIAQIKTIETETIQKRQQIQLDKKVEEDQSFNEKIDKKVEKDNEQFHHKQ